MKGARSVEIETVLPQRKDRKLDTRSKAGKHRLRRWARFRNGARNGARIILQSKI